MPTREFFSTDGELAARVDDGELSALGVLFERYASVVSRHIVRLGVPPHDADDMVQDTFLEFVRSAGRFDASYPLRAWLLGIAGNVVRRRRRSLACQAARIMAWAGLSRSEVPPSPEEQFESDQTLARFARAFERLSFKKREVFALVTLEGLSGAEAAAALGIPVNTVWTRLHHARHELRAALDEDLP